MPDWCRKCPFYYKGMTPEDYLYLQYIIRMSGPDLINRISKHEIELPPLEERTKEDVFNIFGADLDYVFDIDTMC